MKQYLEKIKNYPICILGLGGLGSNCANGLVRLGFKKLTLIDFDIIDESNLNRQFYFRDQIGKFKTEALKDNLLRIHSDLELNLVNSRITKDNLCNLTKSSSIVVEALDNANQKKDVYQILWNKKIIIGASGLGNYWDISMETRDLTKNLTVIGDFKSNINTGCMPLYPGVLAASSIQVAQVLKKVLEDSYV